MSDLNEELLSDDNDDCVDIEEELEDALLQDDPEEEVINSSQLDQSETEPKNLSLPDQEEEKSSRPDKFATERKPITAPEPTDNNEQQVNNRFQRYNRGGRGGRFPQQMRQRGERFTQNRQFNNPNRHMRDQNSCPRGKTVFVNPNFQGVVKVNNNAARLAWDPQQPAHSQVQPNPWYNNTPGNMMQPQMQDYRHQQFQPPMQQMQSLQHMQPVQNMGPLQMHPMQGPPQMQPMQNMGSPQVQYVPQYQPSFGGPQYEPNQGPNHHQGMMPYIQNNYDTQPIIINTANPPPCIQNSQYSNQFNQNIAPPMMQQQPEFMPTSFQTQDMRQVTVQNHRNSFHNNVGQNNHDSFSPKRKVGNGTFSQNKKRVQERLGVKMPQVKSKNLAFKTEDRPSVVTEVNRTEMTTVKFTDDDTATADLRRKIEEQKRKREEILKWKEARRLEQLKQVETEHNDEAHTEDIRPVQRLIQGQTRERGGYPQQNRLQQQQSMANRKPVLHQLTQADHQTSPTARGLRGGRNARVILNNRTVSVAAPSTVTLNKNIVQQSEEDGSDVKLDEVHLSNFLESRKVLVADKALMSTRQVFIKNIATSTGDKKIIQICRDIGEVQKLHRDNNERHATITFKSVASAHAFYKKYQRHLLDLSMIEVTLTPESTQE
ncbi:RNA-binding protein 33-like isoform X2 [Anthonomus grandis grandis]|uniref:RNA-binding protein 33-like isoform X2 n=1 Tax=Anthonomus grandis grandis TaxID=2921223 RepID=UPI0021663DFA|nr:RNA-binding protein 33-like isoform X2 [Anthonomus grandis grandis]